MTIQLEDIQEDINDLKSEFDHLSQFTDIYFNRGNNSFVFENYKFDEGETPIEVSADEIMEKVHNTIDEGTDPDRIVLRTMEVLDEYAGQILESENCEND